MKDIFIRGFLIGLAIAAPVGPIGVLVIRRTLANGRLIGLVSGLGAATADACYGSLAAFGLTLVSSAMVRQQEWLRLVGGIFLCYLGFRTFLAKPGETAPSQGSRGILSAYSSTFFLTLTNPLTILSFAAIFAGLGLASSSDDYLAATLMVLGVFCGSATWWLLLSGSVGLLRQRVSPTMMIWINRISGTIIFGFGVFALVTLLI